MSTLLQRLDNELHSFVDSFANLIQASRIGKADTSKSQGNKVPDDLLEVLAEKLVISGQVLVHLISELKSNAVVNDFKRLNQNIAALDKQKHQDVVELQARLKKLQQQLCQLQLCQLQLSASSE